MISPETTQATPDAWTNSIGAIDGELQAILARHSDTPRLDGIVLLSHILGQPRSWVIAHPEYRLDQTEMFRLKEAAGRLECGVPLPYVLGTRDFFGLAFKITPDVLIPRPETELLVEQAIHWVRRHPEKRLAADIGTGSGCIAVALAKNLPDLRLVATDVSAASLRIAKENIELHSVSSQVSLIQADLLAPVSQQFDMICANLPYIPDRILNTLRVSAWEPPQALDGGPGGLAVISRFLAGAARNLRAGGVILLEIESSQGPASLALAKRAFPGAAVLLSQDLSGQDRILSIEAPN